jgi:transcriptional regulator with XRE-family HTH domain
MPFAEWLRNQLKARRMSARHLAHKSGVDPSSISRLMRGMRAPSLVTATKLARVLDAPGDGTALPYELRAVATSVTHPTARVEYALRVDDLFGEREVRQVMQYYLALRGRRAEAAQREPTATVTNGNARIHSTN